MTRLERARVNLTSCQFRTRSTLLINEHVLCLHSGKYGQHLHVWDWKARELKQSIDLGDDGKIPLEVRFLHDPDANLGYVGCALSSTVFAFQPSKVGRALIYLTITEHVKLTANMK